MERVTMIKHKDDENMFDTYELTMESQASSIHTLLEDIKMFLVGCGYDSNIVSRIEVADA
jgi:hypothetical protein